MLPAYKLVVVNLVLSALLAIGLITYRYIFSKRKINPFYLLILISMLPIISIFRMGTYESGDFSINVYKSMSFFNSLSEGNIIPRWAGELNATYGYPLFIFTYPLPFYIVSFFHFFGFSFILSLKLLIAISFITSGIFMYLWVKEELGKLPAIVASIFYLYSPYHLVDTHFRISIGEIVSFAILPLSLFSIKKFIKYPKLKWFLLIVSSFFLLFLCNPAISLVAIVIIVIYATFAWKENKANIVALRNCFFAIMLSLFLSAFYWIPVIAESKYTHQNLYVKEISFVQIQNLLYSPWKFGLLFQGPKGELSFAVGYLQLIVIALCMLFLYKNFFTNQEKAKAVLYLSLVFIFCFFMLPQSKFIWDNVSILRNFQFTYRLLLFVSLFTALLAGIVARKINKKLLLILCVAAILQTILNWGNRGTIPSINDDTLKSNLSYSTYEGEGFHPATPKWVDYKNPWKKIVPEEHLEILQGDASVKELRRTSTKHEYEIKINHPSFFKENTLYFPNWTATANDKNISIKYDDQKYPGIITFKLDKGLYHVNVIFNDTPIRIVSKFISVTTFGMLLALLFLKKIKII